MLRASAELLLLIPPLLHPHYSVLDLGHISQLDERVDIPSADVGDMVSSARSSSPRRTFPHTSTLDSLRLDVNTREHIAFLCP